MKWVLLVDDSATDRQLLRYNFDWYGYRSIEAANGLEGLEQARNCKELNLIISDAGMPVMDGFQFLQSVKHDPALRKIPFIFYSAVYTSRQDGELALRMGARAFIAKPKGREEFWTEVCKALLEPEASFPPPRPRTIDNEEFVLEHSRILGSKR
ncbi:MAG: response regulator [Deltaproteobacteria bacterium]|nr:response regulator [Deltaproteobacteria bacterium]